MTATTFRRFLYSAPGACSLRASSSICCALLLGTLAASAHAATLSWDANGTSPVNGGSGVWDTSAPLWTSNGGVSYVAWNNNGQVSGTPDSASFATPAGTVTLATSIIGNSMTFVDPGGYTVDLNGFDLTLSGSTSGVASTTITNNSATTSTLSLTTIGGVTMSGNLNVTKEGTAGWTPSVPHSFTGVLTLKGGTTTITNNNFLGSPSGLIRLQDTAGLTLNANATFTRDIELVGTGTGITPGDKTVTLSGDIMGTGDFKRTGSQGTVILAGNNSYSGATILTNAGSTLIAASDNAFGNTSDFQFSFAASTLGFQGNINVPAWDTVGAGDVMVMNLSGTGGKGGIHNFDGNNSVAGNFQMFTNPGSWGAEANSSLLLKGIVSGGDSRPFTKIGAGTIELEGANTFSGQVRVRQGTLVVRNNSPAGGLDGALGRDTNGSSALRIVQLGDTLVSNVNDDIALLTNGPFTVPRNIAVNNTNPTAQTTLGGANTSGTATYSGAITLARDVNLSSAVGGNVDFSGNISGAFGVTVLGGGTVVYTGAKNYIGATNVNDGTLLVNGVLSATNAQVIVNDGGTLGGSGTIGTTTATVTIQGGGTLAPGASVGTLNIGTAGTGNNVVFGGTAGNHAIYHVEIDGLTDDSDLLVVNGNLDLSGAFDELNVSILGPPPTSKTHIIATYTGTLSGIFDFVPTGYSVNYGTGVNSFISLSVGAIPEPSSLLLLAFGAVFVARRRPVRSCQKGKARRPSVH